MTICLNHLFDMILPFVPYPLAQCFRKPQHTSASVHKTPEKMPGKQNAMYDMKNNMVRSAMLLLYNSLSAFLFDKSRCFLMGILTYMQQSPFRPTFNDQGGWVPERHSVDPAKKS